MKKASLRERLTYLREVFERLHEAGWEYRGGMTSMYATKVPTSSEHSPREVPLTGTLLADFALVGDWTYREHKPWVLLTLEVDDVRDIVVDCDPRLHALLKEEA